MREILDALSKMQIVPKKEGGFIAAAAMQEWTQEIINLALLACHVESCPSCGDNGVGYCDEYEALGGKSKHWSDE